jgi:signal transduction histidine kinase
MSHSTDLRDAEAWQRQLEEAKLAALAEFAAGAGHEINNPLAVICGRVELLLRQETHPERRRDLATIHAQARRVYEMIADLMLFARPPRPVLATLDLTALAEELRSELAPRCQERGIGLRTAIESQPIEILGDRSQLLVALRAVCDNALEALGPGGWIEIASRSQSARSARTACIEIRDNGPGFDELVRRHLFDPFFSGRTAGRGLGMGLAKCWRIVRLHDGSIEAESPPEGGATFAITLPAGAAEPAAKGPVAKEPVGKRGAHRGANGAARGA